MADARLPSYMQPRYRRGTRILVGYWWARPFWADPKKANSPDQKERKRALRNGKTCPFVTSPLGKDLAQAIAKAEAINLGFKEWCAGVETTPLKGTVKWLFWWYRQQDEFLGLRHKTRKDYSGQLDSVAAVAMKLGTFGDKEIRLVDKEVAVNLYKKIRAGRERQAAYEMSTCRAVWSLAERNTSQTGVKANTNPFTRMKLKTKAAKGNLAADRAQYDLFRAKARELGIQAMAAAAALAFECCQRVWDVFGFEDPDGLVDRGIKWSGYRPGVKIEVVQSKTGAIVALPLADLVDGETVLLYPELEEELARLERPAIITAENDIIIRDQRTGKPYTVDYMQKQFRKIREAAGLPAGWTCTTLRHGGLTETGDAGVEDVRAVSGHTQISTTTIYNKVTERKARAIAVKRREHIALITQGEEEESA